MNPLSPEKILRNLDHGFFMTHEEQAEAAQYIRQLQQENLTLLGKPEQNKPLRLSPMYEYGHIHDASQPEQECPTLRQVVIESALKGYGKPEQELVCDKDPSLCGFVLCQLGKVCKHTPRNTMPTKIFAPNLEQILNAAGFYRREWVCKNCGEQNVN
jgi:hypothetical protein